MICYNITIKIDPRIEREWIRWQMEEHIPEVMASKLFSDHKFFKLLEQDERVLTDAHAEIGARKLHAIVAVVDLTFTSQPSRNGGPARITLLTC